ncbi:hypothetical protein BCR44DRAFT_224995 [Catenaria anguillulae PL171]|uniref:ABC-type glycine betaine transport system substrate-binding domain-containing protein n=1 Tax=Catenaria anguillulae PL171 TaxID=765915 RepID=A0A1Y2HEX4_9FUNG|nr:hypothetical protein BCR44DRAFT_224995 [Catenaria anguillulae PL171]
MASPIATHRSKTRIATMTVAIVAALCILLLATAPTFVQSQTQRNVPACIPLETAKPFKWVGQRPEDPNIVTLQAPPATVLLEYNGWASANITGYLSAILLRDVMGVDAKLIEYRSSFNSYPRTAAGTVHVNVEVWAGAKISLYNRYIRQEQTVEDLGLIGYFGKTSWYINSAIADANPSLIFDSWRSFTQQNVLNFFPAAGTTTAGRTADNTKWICDPSKYSYCNNNGIFVPPQCQGGLFSSCKEFWHIGNDLSPLSV